MHFICMDMKDSVRIQVALDCLTINILRKFVATGNIAGDVSKVVSLHHMFHMNLEKVSDVLHFDLLRKEVVGFESNFEVIVVVEDLEISKFG